MAKAKYTSSKGTAMWPWLAKPDTRFDAEGKYKTDLLVKKEDAQEFVDMAKQIFIEEFGEKSLAKAKWPFMNDDEAGGIKIRAKSSKKPTLFDASAYNDPCLSAAPVPSCSSTELVSLPYKFRADELLPWNLVPSLKCT